MTDRPATNQRTSERLPSWNPGPTRDAIEAFLDAAPIRGTTYQPMLELIAALR